MLGFLLWLVFQLLHNIDESFLGKHPSLILLLVESVKVLHHFIKSVDSKVILNKK